jgi:hypothetical protein
MGYQITSKDIKEISIAKKQKRDQFGKYIVLGLVIEYFDKD